MKPLDYWTCTEVLARLDDYVDRELAPADLERIRDHLHMCSVCASEFRFEESVIRQVRARLRRIAVPASLEAEVWRSLNRARAAGSGEPGSG